MYSHRAVFTKLGEVTDTAKGMNLLHFDSDPANTQIWINTEIHIRIPDHCWLSQSKYLRWQTYALTEFYAMYSICLYVFIYDVLQCYGHKPIAVSTKT